MQETHAHAKMSLERENEKQHKTRNKKILTEKGEGG